MGVRLLSKLSQLKQKAYQAGKNRNWDEAIDCYEQILELEKNNPTVVNELGDLCLKAGQTSRAVKHFLTAASRYRKTGLLNNSVAIYKKILRHDDANLNAHWYLADIRSGQGLLVEGQDHASRFLTGSSNMPGEHTEIFQKRFVKLFELYPESPVILDKLAGLLRTRDMGLEAARAQILLACCVWRDGKEDEAKATVAEVLEKNPEVRNYAEFARWSQCLDPNAGQANQQADFNTVSFDDGEPTAESADGAGSTPTVEIPAPDETPVVEIPSVGDVPVVEIPVDVDPEVVAAPEDAPADDGCISIDVEGDTDFSELIAAATADGVPQGEGEAEEVFDENPVAPEVEVPAPAEEKVDLLAQILSEEGGGLGDESQQLDTISAQIGSVVGGDSDVDDAGRLYEMGMVYLEMGMFDQACESFSVAACDEEFALRAHEMWGMTLQKAGNHDECVRVLTEGLTFAADGSREHLTLRYHIAQAHEMAGRSEAAQEIYQDIQDASPDFLDVSRRLQEVSG